LAEIGRIEGLLQEKEKFTEYQAHEHFKLHERLKETEALLETTLLNTTQLQMEVTISKTKLIEIEQRLETTMASLTASRTIQAQLTSQPGAPFYDSNTRSAMACPLLQSNGYIIPFKSIITQWFAAAGPSDGYVHRTYICPVMQQPTNIASLAIQDRIRHIAQHTGLNIESPLNFSYMSDDGQWIEFSFNDQLNILAKLCTVQTMQISNCTEHIVIHRNTMAFEINATITSVS
jgi:hypothetical protein